MGVVTRTNDCARNTRVPMGLASLTPTPAVGEIIRTVVSIKLVGLFNPLRQFMFMRICANNNDNGTNIAS